MSLFQYRREAIGCTFGRSGQHHDGELLRLVTFEVGVEHHHRDIRARRVIGIDRRGLLKIPLDRSLGVDLQIAFLAILLQQNQIG